MKSLLGISFWFFIILSVQGQNMRDTAWANRLLKETPRLFISGRYEDVLSKLDTVEIIYLNTVGELCDSYGTVLHRRARVFDVQNKLDTAISLYQKAAKIRTIVLGPNNIDLAHSYSSLGFCYYRKGQYVEAIEYNQKTLSIRLKVLDANHPDIVTSYQNLGICFQLNGNYDQAIDLLQKVIEMCLISLNPDSLLLSESYMSLGGCFNGKGEYDQAIRALKRGLIFMKSANKKNSRFADFYHNLGICYLNKGDYDRAIEANQESINIYLNSTEAGSLETYSSYNSLGICFMRKGDYQKSIEYLQKSLYGRIGVLGYNHPDVSDCYLNLGACYLCMGEYEKSVEFYQKSLNIRLNSIGEAHPYVADSYTSLGLCFQEQNSNNIAIDYYQKALRIYLSSLSSDNPKVAGLYYNLGNCFYKQKKYQESIDFHLKALNARLKLFNINHPDVAASYNMLGNCFYEKGEYDKAVRYFDQALDVINKLQENDSIFSVPVTEKIDVLVSIAKMGYSRYLYTKQKFWLQDSYKSYVEARKVITFFHKRVSEDRSKNFFIQKRLSALEGNIITDLSLNSLTDSLNDLQDAFAASEESRSLSLYESLRESDALHFAGIPDSLLQREYDLRVDIAYYDKKRFEEEIEKKKPITDSTLLAINSKLFDLKRAYEALKDTFEQQYPDYYRLKYDLQVESVENVQQSLPPDQALLEYFVGDSSIFIFLVKKNDYRAFEVKKDFPLEDWVKQLRHGIYGYHTADPNRKTDDLRDSCANEYIESATALYQKLLAPVDSLLPRRVVIVPDGALGYIPFEALLTDRPKRANRFHEYPYFGGQTGKEHSISYCYSATLLREMTTRQHRQTPGKSFLAYAPYYDGDTTLLASRSIDPNNPANRLPPLKYATEEVEALHGIMGGKAVIGRSARKDSLIQEAGQYRIVHLSTHGKANDKVGDYSFLAFSEVKDSVDNEWLYVRDIYNLSLNADMVVLSACETGIGELKRGEGIISLARAFAYAGAKSIVTTLWSVDDAKTKDLMIFFYRHLKQGMTKDEALAKARSDYFEKYKSGDAHPFFWAGFIGIGDMGAVK